jgi:MFS family permease
MFEGLRASLGINRTVLALSLGRMGDAIGNSILFITIPLYVITLPRIDFHLSIPVSVGILISSYGLTNAALQPFMAALSDRYGRHKPLIQVGLVVMGIATLFFSLADCYLDLLILRMAQGLGLALTVPPALALMTLVTQKTTRGGAMGVYTTMRMLGLTLGPLLGGFLYDHFGFNVAFYAGAGILFLTVGVVQLWVEDVSPHGRSSEIQAVRIFEPSVMLDPGILSAGFATFLMASAFSMVTTLENEFNARLDINAFGFSVAYSALMVGRLMFQVPSGHLSDHIGRKPLVLVGLLLLAPVTALLGGVTTLFQFIALRFVQGIAASAIVAPALAVAGDLAKTGGESREVSVVTIGFTLGIAFGPLLAGFLSAVFFDLPFLTSGFLSLIGALIVYRYMPETVHREEV